MMYDLIVFLPLVGFLVAGLFGRQIGRAQRRVRHDRPSVRLAPPLLDRVLFGRVGSQKRR